MKVQRDVFADGQMAHTSLRGQIDATQFTDGTLLRVTTPVADLRLDLSAPGLDRQILHGFPVRRLAGDHAPCRDETSGYVGYIQPDQLGPWQTPTHRVAGARTLAFAEPDFKTANPGLLSCGSLVTITTTQGRYARTIDGTWIITEHLLPVDARQPDLATTADKLIATPYLWGGNSAFGIDCSGLIQLACQAAGIPCPGDSDQQQDQLGTHLPKNTPPQRNDLLFWKGHVALVTDPDTLIHANAHHMSVAYEPLTDACRRIDSQGDGPCLTHKRFLPSSV